LNHAGEHGLHCRTNILIHFSFVFGGTLMGAVGSVQIMHIKWCYFGKQI